MELTPNFLLSLLAQMAMVVAIVQSNRTTIGHLKEQNRDLKEWLTALQKTVNDMRAKIGH